MRRLGVVLGLFGLFGCGGPSAEELASLAAKGYYEQLIRGEYEQFLDGKAGLDLQGEASYRSQLLDNCRQFMSQQESAHHGIREVRVSNVSTDSLLGCTNVFLVLCYGDSTNEEIVMPMVETNGSWRMK